MCEEFYKHLITYDIAGNDYEVRENVECYLKNLQYHPKWVHLQGSVWIVLSRYSDEGEYINLLGYISDYKISVVDVTRKPVYLNHEIYETSNINDKEILNSDY